MQGVYLLHFERPVVFPNPTRYGDERHYFGCSTNVMARIRQHVTGEGSKMTKAAYEQGIPMTLTAVWPVGLVTAETILTKAGARRLCTTCILDNYVPPEKKHDVFSAKYSGQCTVCNDKIYPGMVVYKTQTGVACYRHAVR